MFGGYGSSYRRRRVGSPENQRPAEPSNEQRPPSGGRALIRVDVRSDVGLAIVDRDLLDVEGTVAIGEGRDVCPSVARGYPGSMSACIARFVMDCCWGAGRLTYRLPED